MTDFTAKKKVRTIISAKVTRADGTVEDLGIIVDSADKSTPWSKFKKLFGG